MKNIQTKIGWKTGAAIVIANMIGTGAFTTLGFQLVDLKNTFTLLILWIMGGFLALSGAFSYAEVGTYIRKSGGEYSFLSKLYHPIIGYLSGWISLTVGFAAPIALAAIAFAKYLENSGFGSAKYAGIAAILILSVIHSFNLKLSSGFQNISTILKVGFIVLFILLGLIILPPNENAISLSSSISYEILSPAFAIALIYVSYSYTGWNAATYITEEFKDIQHDLPKALIVATLLVTILYTFLQFVILRHASTSELVNQVDVASIAAANMFENNISKLFSGAISLLLVSSISAMIWVGPRVSAKMAEDHKLWYFLQPRKAGIPVKAIWFQTMLSIILILTGTFEQILIYCGVLLNFSSALVVFGVFILRKKHKSTTNFKGPGYPFIQIFFLLVSIWMISFAIIDKPVEILIGLSNLLLGLLTYFIYFKSKIKPI